MFARTVSSGDANEREEDEMCVIKRESCSVCVQIRFAVIVGNTERVILVRANILYCFFIK